MKLHNLFLYRCRQLKFTFVSSSLFYFSYFLSFFIFHFSFFHFSFFILTITFTFTFFIIIFLIKPKLTQQEHRTENINGVYFQILLNATKPIQCGLPTHGWPLSASGVRHMPSTSQLLFLVRLWKFLVCFMRIPYYVDERSPHPFSLPHLSLPPFSLHRNQVSPILL
jgi:hypothetical protein